MLSRAQNTFHHNPCLRGPVSSVYIMFRPSNLSNSTSNPDFTIPVKNECNTL